MPDSRNKSAGKKTKCNVVDAKGKKCTKTLTANGQCPVHGPWN
jgi:hypothetical protein